MEDFVEHYHRELANQYYDVLSLERWQKRGIKRRRKYEQAARATWRYTTTTLSLVNAAFCIAHIMLAETGASEPLLERGLGCLFGLISVFIAEASDRPPTIWVLLHKGVGKYGKDCACRGNNRSASVGENRKDNPRQKMGTNRGTKVREKIGSRRVALS